MNQEIQVVEKKFNDIVSLINDVGTDIETQEQYENCMLAMQQFKVIKGTWVALFEDIRVAQKDALDVTYATINKLKIPCDNNVALLTPKCFRWERKQEAAARAEQDRLQAEAKKAVEDAMLEEAAHLHKQGDREAAEAVLTAPIPVIPVIVVQPAFKAGLAGVAAPSRRLKWKARVTDFAALVKAVHEGKSPKTLLIENQKVLDDMAAALGKELNIPGVESYEEPNYAKGRS